MHLKTFGGAALEGTSLSRPKPLLLLGYLAVEGARSRQHLRELFWPTAADPATSLRVAVRQIREAAPNALKIENDILSLLLPSDVSELLTAFRNSPERVPHIYQGEFFSGISLDKTDEESELGAWLLTTREHFAGQVRSSLLHLAERQIGQGNRADAAELVRQVRYLPGAKPLDADELQKLYTLSLKTQSELSFLLREEAEEFGATLTGLDEPQNGGVSHETLPRATTSFIGRRNELRELLNLLKEPETRLITIEGVGGVGKTRLGLELAQLQGTNQMAFVQLTNVSAPDALPQIIAQNMRLNLAGGAPPLALITSAIGEKSFTLYLDNYEQLLPDTQVIQELLAACPNLRIVVTSRERLELEMETVFPVAGLDQSDGEHSDAARLFLSRARQANARFRPTPELWRLVLEICQRLDGSPLAIELAAGWVRRMPVQQIAEELSRGLELLEVGGDNAGKRKSLRAIFEQSWQKLSAAEQQLLVALGVFRGGFTRESAAAITGATLRPLLTLLDTAFLNVSEAGRYTQHPLLAHFVQEKTATFTDELLSVERQFVQYFSEKAWNIWKNYFGAEELLHIQWGNEEYDNLAAAIALAVQAEDVVPALELCIFQAFGWQSRGLIREGAEQFEAPLTKAKTLSLQQEPAYRWGLQMQCQLRLHSGGWNEEAAQRLEEAKQLASDAGDIACLTQCLVLEALQKGVTGKLAEGKAILLAALEQLEATAAHDEQAQVYILLVSINNNLEGGGEEAEHYLQVGLQYAEKYRLDRAKGHLLLRRSERLVGTGFYDEAQEMLDEVEAIFAARHMTKELALVYKLRSLAAYFGCQPGEIGANERLDVASADMETSYRLNAGNVVNRTMDLLIPQQGDILLARGELEAAETVFRTGLTEAQAEAIRPLVINCSLGLGRTLYAQERYSEALPYLRTALELTRMPTVWCIAAEVAAATLARSDDLETAVQFWGRAIQEREDVEAMRFPVYAEYYEPEVAQVKKRLSEQKFQQLFEAGRKLEKPDVIVLLNVSQSGKSICQNVTYQDK